jgi:hypothetical protein
MHALWIAAAAFLVLLIVLIFALTWGLVRRRD